MDTASPTPTPEIATALPTETLPPPASVTPPPLPTATISAMQLFFPTVIPVASAEYRPPLYPIPWALSPYDHFYFARPIAAAFPAEPEWDYSYGGIYFGPDIIHTGIDLPAPRGTDVLAAGPGTVVWAGVGLFSKSPNNSEDPYGKAVAIQHDFGYKNQPLYTIYAHMDDIDVIVGQWLNTGDVVGEVGSTGITTGPHLHFEVRLGKNAFFYTRNPELWIAPPLGYGVLAGRVMGTGGTLLDKYLVIVKSLDTKQKWNLYTYGSKLTINWDAYYDENVVLGNLPAGLYELAIPYGSLDRKTTIQILPGQVTFFTFSGFNGYDFALPLITQSTTP
jgi:murein DD-endopeptidase MepM/ murein hydrolase activator NlpD